jgi:glycosyltransferase involved in cell wall biosynthesis
MRYGEPATALIAPDGVDLRLAARTHAAGAADRPVLLYIGTRHRRKGIELLLEALRELPQVTLRNSGICMLPSTNTSLRGRYTSPLKLFEYMAMGKPVVAANLPAMRDVLQHGRNALLAEPGSPQSFAACIRDLIGNPPLGRALGEQARSDARGYGWTRRAEQLGAFIGAVLRRPQQGSGFGYYGA